ncbi:hypothetical protein LTR84_006025 [Exophiala bonariae]|uniref:Uncharacterized protein n=1 Tax=Exophiala bonariae TaxID=1690606 RepID=A0AAV9N2M8_9EURO|nr:hypothetical protein LTR84_006025 [Exophiala bonariae]
MQSLRVGSRGLYNLSRTPPSGIVFSSHPVPTASIAQWRCASTRSSFVPRLAEGSVWQSIIPKSLRDRWNGVDNSGKKKPANPATYFIWIYLLIGSQAIRIMGVQTEFNTYMRKADIKLNKLREVVEKLQKGQEVDVEKALGTGDEIQEQEWEEALAELVAEDQVWQSNRRKAREESERLAAEEQDANPINRAIITDHEPSVTIAPSANTPRPGPGFY